MMEVSGSSPFLHVYTIIHVLISLVAIGSGFGVLAGWLGNRLSGWTTFFLITTLLTSVTGFFFPWQGVTPGIVIGVLSVLVLIPAFYGLYARGLSGGWRRTFVITAWVAQYFNFFVFLTQSFQKVPALHMMAPVGQPGPLFAAAQGVTLVAFIVLGVLAAKRFRGAGV